MKQLISRKHPNFAPQILSDEEFELLKAHGAHNKYVVTEIVPMAMQISKLPIIPAAPIKDSPALVKSSGTRSKSKK